MFAPALLLPFLLVPGILAQDDGDDVPTHGEGEEGSSMGPVAFMWPPDRAWSAAADNVAPCGSRQGPGNRTEFPLSQGSVALSIADEAWEVVIRVAYEDNPTTQSAFSDQIVNTISELEAGHACYKIDELESVAKAGGNATIQLEYWSEFEGENNGNEQKFYACADVTFVEPQDFTITTPCFNVTSDDFNPPAPEETSTSTTTPSNGNSTAAASPSSSNNDDGLSNGAKAGIAVGAIVGGLAIFGLVAIFLYRKGKFVGLRKKGEYDIRARELKDAQSTGTRSVV